MISSLNDARLILPTSYTCDAESQIEQAGMIEGATIQLPNGSNYLATFADCKRIARELESSEHKGTRFFSKPGLLVVSRASTWVSTLAACWAANQGYFEHLIPLPSPQISSSVKSIAYENGDERESLVEARNRGYLENVDVEIADGRHYLVAFMLLMRVSREIELDCMNGRPFFVHPGLIIVDEFTPAHLRLAVVSLAQLGYFEHLKSVLHMARPGA